MSETGIVNIRGREYKTVALRVQEFRGEHPIKDGWAIVTELMDAPDQVVRMRARIVDPEQRIVATGIAEERRGSSQINKTSALENCETSAIGRCLSAAGYGGAEYASANEVEAAIAQQDEPPPRASVTPHPAATEKYIKSMQTLEAGLIAALKHAGRDTNEAPSIIGRIMGDFGVERWEEITAVEVQREAWQRLRDAVKANDDMAPSHDDSEEPGE